MTALVYMAVNTRTGERYIGATAKSLEHRIKTHWKRVRAHQDRGIFTGILRLYGEAAFRWVVLATFQTHEAAYEAERFFISLIKPEYNVSVGGANGLIGARRAPISDNGRDALRKRGLENKEKWAKYAVLGPLSMRRRVRCLNDGAEYESIKIAAETYDVARFALNELCLGQRGRKTVGGRRFEFV